MSHTDDLKNVLEIGQRIHNNFWFGSIVPAVNAYREAVAKGEAPRINSLNFPPEILRLIDCPALRTGWIYERLETASDQQPKCLHTTDEMIRKVLGYYPELRNGAPVKKPKPTDSQGG